GTTRCLAARGDIGGIMPARSELSEEAEAYLELVVYPGERELWQKISTELAEIDRISGRALSLVSQGRVAQADELADREMRAVFDRANDAFTASIGLNARQAPALARTIEEHRERTRLIAFALDGLSIALAALAG